MTTLVVQHETDCPPGLLARDDLPTRVVHPYRGDPVPADLDGIDALIVLGGEMGATDDDRHPWLAPTRGLITLAVEAELPTLLICLGHQLGAVALGGAIETSPLGALRGVVPMGLTDEGRDDVLLGRLAGGAHAVHWNSDLVTELPTDATVLARDPRGGLQAVRYGPLAWGVQCHPEVDVDIVSRWAASDAGQSTPESAEGAREALEQTRRHIETVHDAWRPVLDTFVDLVNANAR